jgi:glutathione synthase/RimK-type ligase-like ATP-grasp enzyme
MVFPLAEGFESVTAMTGEDQTIRQSCEASSVSADLLLATCHSWSDGEPGREHLDAALAARAIDARWAAWDDPDVDWSGSLVAVRSTWDYDARRDEFLAWARSVPRLLNGADVFAWNTDKAYLAELAAAGVSVVPTIVVDGEEELPAAIAALTSRPSDAAVVKPRVGAGGRGVVVFDGRDGGPAELDESMLGPGPWVVQPLVESVRTEGEGTVFVLDGEVVSAAQKRPAAGEIRVHEQYGGSTVAVPVSDEAAELARRTVAAAEEILGHALDYARVDHMRLADGRLAVSELEATEPGLYLDELPANGVVFADLVLHRLSGAASL